MSQVTQTEIDAQQGEGSGNDVRLIINALFDAAVTKNSGPTPPPDPRPFMEWHNTTDDTLQKRDGANTAWLIQQSFGKTDAPTTSENELNGYAPGSEWFTASARAFKHSGGGVWVELGEAQAASLFAPTIGVLGGKRFGPSSDGTINSVVNGGPRFALGASAPTPVPDRYTYGLLASVRFPITLVAFGSAGTDPTFVQSGLFSYLQLAPTTSGPLFFDFPVLTAPTFLNLKLCHFLSTGSVGTMTWSVACARLQDMSSITFGTPTTLAITTSALNLRQTSHILLSSAGAVIGDVLRVSVSRATGGTAGTLLLTDIVIEQNP